MENKEYISDELLAAYLDGNTSEEETQWILQALKTDTLLQETLGVAMNVEEYNYQLNNNTKEVSLAEDRKSVV